jgi:hypothetical protein
LLEVLSNGVVVAQTTVNSGRMARLRTAAGTALRGPDSLVLDWDAVAGRNYCWVRWFFDQDISGRACAVVLGDLPDTVDVIDNSDSLRLSAISPTATMGALSRVELRGVNSGDFWLRDQAIELLGHWHRAVGAALVDTTADSNGPPTLRVGNLGSSGEDGFEVFAGGSDIWDMGDEFNSGRKRIVQAWPDDGETPWPTSSNSYVKWTATGRIQGSSNSFENLSELTSFRQEQATLLTANFARSLSPTQELMEVFNGPTLVGSFTLPVGLVGTFPSTARVTRVSVSVTDGNLSTVLATRFPQPFAPADGSSVLTGDRVRITALNPQATVENLRSLITRGANVDSFAFRSFNTATPQRPRLGTPRLLSGGRIEIRVPSEPDVTYDIERSQTLLPGSWTRIGRVMGTDGSNTTSFFDIFVGNEAFHRIRTR